MAGSELKPSDLPHLTVLYPAVRNNEMGEILVGEPEEIQARWEEGYSRSRGAQSNKESISHRIFIPQVISLGSVLWRGSLDDLEALGDQAPTDLVRVVEYTSIEDLKGAVASRYVLVAKQPKLLKVV